MSRARFGPANPAIEQQQTYALDRTATAMGLIYYQRLIIIVMTFIF